MESLDVVGVDMDVGEAFPAHARARFDAGLGGGLRAALTRARVAARYAEGRRVAVAIQAVFANGDAYQATGEGAGAHEAFDAAFERLEKQARRNARARKARRRAPPPNPPEDEA